MAKDPRIIVSDREIYVKNIMTDSANSMNITLKLYVSK